MRILLFIATLFAFSCNAQNSITANEVIVTKDGLFGVISKNGKLLIDSVYSEIKVLPGFEQILLPPRESRQMTSRPAYYLVINSNGQKALFDQNGELIVDFITCKYIAFITHSDLFALIVADSPNEEFYLYNPKTKKKLGPFDHFNIFNEDMSTFGFTASEAERLQKLNIITVRRKVENDYLWGMIDAKGNEILPLAYRNFATMTESDKRHPVYKKASKPEGVEFIFRATHISNPSTIIYFDSNFDQYQMKSIIEKGEYRFEKL